jgi:hypothetical protein
MNVFFLHQPGQTKEDIRKRNAEGADATFMSTCDGTKRKRGVETRRIRG